MGRILPGSEDAVRIENALKEWRQGDFTLRKVHFQTLHHPKESAMDGWEPNEEDTDEPFLGSVLKEGAVLISQTCDVIRGLTSTNKKFLQFCALEKLSLEELTEVKHGKSPLFAYVPGAAKHGMAANLTWVTMVEKPLAASWERQKGCYSDTESTEFAESIARHKQRYAFPDDFSDHVVRPFQARAEKRHNSQASRTSSDRNERRSALESAGFQALKEIRVAAKPSWDKPDNLSIILILNKADCGLTPAEWEEVRGLWQGLLKPHGQIKTIDVESPTVLDEISASDYLASHRLDLDYLSGTETESTQPE